MDINRYSLRSILVATDLGRTSDAVVISAARLAAQTGAELHLLHSLELPWQPDGDTQRRSDFHDQIEAAENRLQDQVRRTMSDGLRPASQHVTTYIAHTAIQDRADEVSADVIVMGCHRGGATGSRFLGTTADRVIRTAAVPCLVVEEPLVEKIRRIGVSLDFSDTSQGALEIGLAWGLQVGDSADVEASRTPEVRVMHVGWTVEQIDNPDREEHVLVPELTRQVERARSRISAAESLNIGIEVLWGNNPTEETVLWVKRSGIDLLVMGTRGSIGLKRILLGSVASSVARQNPCPVLLVPPSLWSGHEFAPRLERVMIATDLHESALDVARWSTRAIAPKAEHLLVHVLEVPVPPPLLASRYRFSEEMLRTMREGVRQRMENLRIALEPVPQLGGTATITPMVREGLPADEIVHLAETADVDLIVMGRQGTNESGARMRPGTTVERVLRASPIPVLVPRGQLTGPPRNFLVAMDGSKPSQRALAWADFLRNRFGGTVTVLHVETPLMLEHGNQVPWSFDVSSVEAQSTSTEPEWMRAREQWLQEQVGRAGIDPETVSIQVAIGKPADEILAEQERRGADLLVMGTHGKGMLASALLGSVARGVLHRSPCSVLVVGSPSWARA